MVVSKDVRIVYLPQKQQQTLLSANIVPIIGANLALQRKFITRFLAAKSDASRNSVRSLSESEGVGIKNTEFDVNPSDNCWCLTLISKGKSDLYYTDINDAGCPQRSSVTNVGMEENIGPLYSWNMLSGYAGGSRQTYGKPAQYAGKNHYEERRNGTDIIFVSGNERVNRAQRGDYRGGLVFVGGLILIPILSSLYWRLLNGGWR